MHVDLCVWFTTFVAVFVEGFIFYSKGSKHIIGSKKQGVTFSWFERKGQGHSQVGLAIACASRRVSQEDFYLSGRPSTRFAVKPKLNK